MTIEEAQQAVDKWIKENGVRYFSELTKHGLPHRRGRGISYGVMARTYGDRASRRVRKQFRRRNG